MPILSDFDQTYDTHPELKSIVDVIVTGSSYQEFDRIRDEMGEIDKPVFFNPVTPNNNTGQLIVLHKANIINKLKASKFFEDQPQEVAQLKILCPTTKIVLVREGVTAI